MGTVSGASDAWNPPSDLPQAVLKLLRSKVFMTYVKTGYEPMTNDAPQATSSKASRQVSKAYLVSDSDILEITVARVLASDAYLWSRVNKELHFVGGMHILPPKQGALSKWGPCNNP